MQGNIFKCKYILIYSPVLAGVTTGNPGSLCVGKYREHNYKAKFRSENLLENGNKNR